MKSPRNPHRDGRISFVWEKKGFTLVITLALMVLLTIIAVGLLSLSAVSLRGSTQAAAKAEAQSNARLALMLAIGELQKQVGPDQRVTANGSITDTDPTDPNSTQVKNPRWTGVWNSWKAGDGTSFHRSVEGESLTGMAPTYQAGRNDHFSSWLVSLTPDEAANWQTARSLTLAGQSMPEESADAVQLVGKGSLGDSSSANNYVSARLIDVKDAASAKPRGRYGWWVGDESQKACIMDDSYAPANLSLAEKIARPQAPGSTGTKIVKGLENLTAENDVKLSALASLQTLNVVPGANTDSNGRPSTNFHAITPYSYSVLADVREGGLKRDLSALLERKIDPTEVDSDPYNFSLYKFNTKDSWASSVSTSPQECVPIQDLAAYYQLYDAVSPEAAAVDPHRTGNLRGVQYAPSAQGGVNGMHVQSTNFGLATNSPIYPREYSSIYRQPRIIKIQFLLSLFSKRIVPAIPADMSNPNPNTHELLIGITPSITFWNPTNLPIVFQLNSNPALSAQMLRFNDTPIQIRFNKNSGQNITAYTTIQSLTGINDGICSLYWAGIHPIRMEPGEVKTCSLPYSGDLSTLKSSHGYQGHWTQGWAMSSFFMKTDTWYVGHEVKTGWEPESFIYCNNSANPGAGNGPNPIPGGTDVRHVVNGRLRFKNTDRIQIQVDSGANNGIGWMNNQSSYQDFCESPLTTGMGLTNWDRYNSICGMRAGAGVAFYQPLFARGMTNGQTTLTSASRSGSSIIARSTTEAGWPFMHFGFMAGTETNATSNGGFGGGRKFANRPFLHSSTLHSYPFLDDNTGNALYNYGWNWTVDLLNDVYEAPVQVTATGTGYWGGGYTPESGTTHIIQQEIPVIPPISIAALSHARLGGWSISDQLEMPYGGSPGQMGHASAIRRRNTTRAVGFGGLRPYTLQAIGNSYAHPQIPADKAYITIPNRVYNTGDPGVFPETFVDHSYLANKALWDEFFFSSITPQRPQVKVFESPSSNLQAVDVAKNLFFKSTPVPNRRIQPYMANMTESKLDELFLQKDLFTNGLADKIAAHLMVRGPFNINSTSVDAWKIFLSSLRGKSVAYLDPSGSMNGDPPTVAASTNGTPIGQTGLAGGPPFTGTPTSPRTANQWTSWRALTDTEINELAVAIVKQVKLRGPFLSLSEFVNRRLDSANPELAVKGALQAALDDPDVSINAAFRANNRKFSAAELATMTPAFPLAAQGPIAYGSSAYIDQADVLRGFSEQLTPRSDTFVIRTYGDSLDANGKVQARAWCEAVVQRIPEYIDSADQPQLKALELTSNASKTFGRKLQIVSLRWLNPKEV